MADAWDSEFSLVDVFWIGWFTGSSSSSATSREGMWSDISFCAASVGGPVESL